jgi:hypothetical protein
MNLQSILVASAAGLSAFYFLRCAFRDLGGGNPRAGGCGKCGGCPAARKG